MTFEASNWRPSASVSILKARGELLAGIHQFFAERGVLQVETPVLAATSALDPQLTSMEVGDEGYLQTSPEFHMKRLLAAGNGCIYQLGKAFRAGEQGRLHNPEFTMLEWYRVGMDHLALLDEVADLVISQLSQSQQLSGEKAYEKEVLVYKDLFQHHLGIDPHTANQNQLVELAQKHTGIDSADHLEQGDLLGLLFSHCIEPTLGAYHNEKQLITFVVDFPVSQAALARVGENADGCPVAKRFELYIQGMELANGYHELSDSVEQRRRFDADLQARAEQGLPAIPLDESLLEALDNLPDCAGVALGVDRLLMLKTGANSIQEVLAFPADRA